MSTQTGTHDDDAVALDWRVLVDADTLAGSLHRKALVVIDCRFSLMAPEAGEAAWRDAHLPDARYAHLDRDLSDHDKQGQGRHPWPDAAKLAARLGALGIGPQHQVVAYDDGDGAFAARLWALLRWLGHRRVAVLDGGWARWNALGLPVETTSPAPPQSVEPYPLPATLAPLLEADAIQAHVDAGGLLVDARAGERFRGEVEPIDKVAGHIPGAVNRPYPQNLQEGRFKSPQQLRTEFDALLAGRAAQDSIVMCGSGVTACHHLLAMAHAGYDDAHPARLYPGSWSGWISDPARPVKTGD